MTPPPSRRTGGSGVALCLLWAPMLVIVPKLPDLASSARIEHFYRDEVDAVRVVTLLASLGFFFFLAFLGGLVGWLRQPGRPEWLTSTAFASSVMFITTLAVALGLVATASLLSARSNPQIIRALHAAAFVSAAPVAPAGVAFFVAIATLSFGSGLFPRGLGWASVLAAIANLGAVTGVLSLSGPLNAGNGAIAGIAAPILAWVLWILIASVWMLRAKHPGVTDDHLQPSLSTTRAGAGTTEGDGNTP